jgi:hypothetical protein
MAARIARVDCAAPAATQRSALPRGRGAAGNPPNRFDKIRLERDEEWDPAQDPSPGTQFLRDLSQSIISYNDSPDIAYHASLNPYRGCEHGCSYFHRCSKSRDARRAWTGMGLSCQPPAFAGRRGRSWGWASKPKAVCNRLQSVQTGKRIEPQKGARGT